MPPLSIEDYHVGIICALYSEMAAVEAMLDEEHDSSALSDAQDSNAYSAGRIYRHNVVIACLPAGVDGLAAAATVASNMLRSFTQLRFGLLVGIGGGVPDLEHGLDIRLGDIVVSQPTGTSGGVVQYDKGKSKTDGEWELKGMLNAPPTVLLTALQKVKARHLRKGSQVSSLTAEMLRQNPTMAKNGYMSPGPDQDLLMCNTLNHADAIGADNARAEYGTILRPKRHSSDPEIHYGIIASGNKVVKNAAMRDRLRQDCGAMCIEMEAAGLMNEFPCLVIRGICDYADAHKNDHWHRYAAANAAAYAKELLLYVSVEQTEKEKPAQQILGE